MKSPFAEYLIRKPCRTKGGTHLLLRPVGKNPFGLNSSRWCISPYRHRACACAPRALRWRSARRATAANLVIADSGGIHTARNQRFEGSMPDNAREYQASHHSRAGHERGGWIGARRSFNESVEAIFCRRRQVQLRVMGWSCL
jgi:hypothetical protein